MKRYIFLLLLPSVLLAQDGNFRYFIAFTDKANTTFSINSPEEYLSVKTIFRRQRFSIAIDSTDIPVSSIYIDNIRSLGFLIENTSKWFNGIIVSTDDSLLVTSLNYTFIDSIISFGSWSNAKKVSKKWTWDYDSSDYGLAFNQLQMLGGDIMHSKGFKGDGIIIAVIDAGFYKVNELNVFAPFQQITSMTFDLPHMKSMFFNTFP